ncbi:MAG: hypothetical protein WD886_01445 [Burkholderiales bacterium]
MPAPHHVLCIHGIGKHVPTWVATKDDGGKSFEATVQQRWAALPTLAKVKFDDAVHLQPVCYDDEIRKLLKNWKDQVGSIKQALKSSPILSAEAERFIPYFDDATANAGADPSTDGDWRETHLADLLIIMGSPTLQQALVAHIVDQMLKHILKWAKEEDGLPRVSVVAHSAGTAMAHKAIQALYNEKVNGISLGDHFQFGLVCMIANVSYTLTRNRETHYDGWLRPSLKVGKGCCTRWINVNHELDPVGRFMPFDPPPSWLELDVEVRQWSRDTVLSALSSKNVHSINHYFRDPRLHVPFFQLLVNAPLTDDEIGKASADFAATTVEGGAKTLVSALKQLDPSHATSFKDWFDDLRAFRKLVRDYAEEWK